MDVLGIVWGIGFVGLWALYLLSPLRRSLRSVIYLAVTSSILLLAPTVGPWPVAAVVATLWAAGLLDLNEILAPMPSREAKFERALWRIRGDVLAHRKRLTLANWPDQEARHRAVIGAAIERTRLLQPPAAEWSGLRDAVLRALEFDLAVFDGRAPLNAQSADASIDRWNAVSRAWNETRKRRANFWYLR